MQMVKTFVSGNDTESVTVIVILYRTADQLPGFLTCLLNQNLRTWRLVAIDNASPDDSHAVLTTCNDHRISIIRNGNNLGFARAANQGLRAGFDMGANFCVLMNIDTIFDACFLNDLVAARNALGAMVITPRIMFAERPEEAWYAGGHSENGWTFQNVHDPFDKRSPGGPREVEFASGCCLGLTRMAMERVGLLDEGFFVYWEDVDFSLRLKNAGIPIYYVPEPSLLHFGGTASGGSFSRSHMRLYYCSYIQLLRRYFGVTRAVQIMLRMITKEVGRKGRDFGKVSVMAIAMLMGQVARLRAPPVLDPPSEPARVGKA